ncbi:C6 transcription factor [Zalerion maritima]|uniref:C6 transcription factor n=1 Tax=Zalerion maritima TaxID=339359 RepID=A0AAD5RIQ7_9PEZI|nr:C6 transcription factor [Zalerion maritima]
MYTSPSLPNPLNLPTSVPRSHGTSPAALLHHISHHIPLIFPMVSILSSEIVALASQHEYLLASLLSIAASHLRFHNAHRTTSFSQLPDDDDARKSFNTNPPGTKSEPQNPHRLAEHHQKQLALVHFRKALASPITTQSRADALLLTSMLLNHLVFAFVDSEDVEGSWVFTPSHPPTASTTTPSHSPALSASSPPLPAIPRNSLPKKMKSIPKTGEDLSWLGICMGMRPLLGVTWSFLPTSILQPIFEQSDESDRRYSQDGFPLSPQKIKPELLELFGLTYSFDSALFDSSSEGRQTRTISNLSPSETRNKAKGPHHQAENTTEEEREECIPFPRTQPSNPLREPIRILSLLHPLPATAETHYKYNQFIGKITPEFKRLLETRDEKALWVLGYWFGLMRRFRDMELWKNDGLKDKPGSAPRGMWYVSTRVERDYRAICLWLTMARVTDRKGREGQLWSIAMDDLEALG